MYNKQHASGTSTHGNEKKNSFSIILNLLSKHIETIESIGKSI